ncbi:Flavohemoprotein [Dactylellina cionopaga]|nr:Flavohemoprotein [Dactylellina cionopaga]
MGKTEMGQAERQVAMISTPLHGLYIPMGLLIVGTAIVKVEWVGYAITLAFSLAAFKVYRGFPRKVLKPDTFKEFQLKEKTELNHNTAIYRFALPEENDILGLPIGQHVTVSATIDSKEIGRSYTPISSDLNKGYFELLIKSYPTGNISKFIGEMRVGQTIRVKGPKGQMKYSANMVKHFGMLAGGTGITPMLQIIKAILRNPNDKTQVDLVFANVNEDDILLKEDLDELAEREKERLRVHYVLNNAPEGWTGGVGFVTADMIKAWCPAPAKDIKILICGPPPMVSAMKTHCKALGYEPAKPVSKMEHQIFCF